MSKNCCLEMDSAQINNAKMYKHTNCVVPLINYRCKVTSEVVQFLDNLFLKEFMVRERTKGKEDFGIQQMK
jgi:hypothetical protein